MAAHISRNRTPSHTTLPLSLQKKLGLKKNTQQVVTPEAKEQPVASSDSVKLSQTVSVSPTTRKQARPGSDMDVMVRDLERTGGLPKEQKPERKLPREGSDMATMLADIDKANNRLEHTEVHVSPTGTLALLEEPKLPQDSVSINQSKAPKKSDSQTDNALSGGGIAIEGVEHAGNSGAEVLDATVEIAEQSAQVASQSVQGLAGTALETAVQVGSAASGGLSAILAYRGIKTFKEGVKEGDLDKKLEGGNSVAIGARSLATSATLANLVGGGSQVLNQVASVASVAAPVLGVGTAVVDGILGAREMKKGKKLDGALRIGFAMGVAAAAVGGGPIATVAAGAFLAARVGRKINEVRNRQKEAKALKAESPPSASLSKATPGEGLK